MAALFAGIPRLQNGIAGFLLFLFEGYGRP